MGNFEYPEECSQPHCYRRRACGDPGGSSGCILPGLCSFIRGGDHVILLRVLDDLRQFDLQHRHHGGLFIQLVYTDFYHGLVLGSDNHLLDKHNEIVDVERYGSDLDSDTHGDVHGYHDRFCIFDRPGVDPPAGCLPIDDSGLQRHH